MGWWSVRTGTGRIHWGDEPEHDYLWGDSPADVMDKIILDAVAVAWNKCGKAFPNRDMSPVEFLHGLAFCLHKVEKSPDIARLFDGSTENWSLSVSAVCEEE